MTIKKAYEDIVNHLQDNQHASVEDVLPTIIEMASAKKGGGASGGTNFIKDSENNVVAIKCYYFKRWMPLVGDDAVEFGAKAKSATGFNSMCKEGNSLWTKANSVAKKAEASLLGQVSSGELAPEDIAKAREEIANTRAIIVETDLGFENKEDLTTYLEENEVTLS